MVNITKKKESILMKIEDVMQKDVINLMNLIKSLMWHRVSRENKISGAPVVNKENKVIGVISEGDIMRLLEIHSPKINPIFQHPST